MNKKNENKIPVLSFFSGGGFLDMGFEQAGFSIIWTNENNKLFARMHSMGITEWRKARGNGIKAEIFNTNSIVEITPSQILAEAFRSEVPDNFGIIGGPPCQDFSSSGNNEGFKGERGHLTQVYFDYILQLKPLFFVFENVKNLWNSNNHRKHLNSILKDIKKEYYIDHEILNSINFGVPQDRNRLFIIGIKKREKLSNEVLELEFKFPWPSNPLYKDALSRFVWPDMDSFQNDKTSMSNAPPELYINSLMLSNEQEVTIPNGNEYFLPYSKKIWEIEEGNTHNRSFKRLHRFRYSPTACYGNNEVHLHPFLPRRISVREALRIQSVEDTYILPSDIGLNQKFKMIGNGVPVKLAKEVAGAVHSFLNLYLKS